VRSVSVLAGRKGKPGYIDGRASNSRSGALFHGPSGVAVDYHGNVLVADVENQRIRIISPDGDVSTLAGSGTKGLRDGDGENALFNLGCETDIATDGEASVYVADMNNNCVRKVTINGTVTTLGGVSEDDQFCSGTVSTLLEEVREEYKGGAALGRSVIFHCNSRLAVDSRGSVLITDSKKHCIRALHVGLTPPKFRDGKGKWRALRSRRRLKNVCND